MEVHELCPPVPRLDPSPIEVAADDVHVRHGADDAILGIPSRGPVFNAKANGKCKQIVRIRRPEVFCYEAATAIVEADGRHDGDGIPTPLASTVVRNRLADDCRSDVDGSGFVDFDDFTYYVG
ncbi:MAG: hypothetical protein IT435_17575, partial [Phycisphaerales bacterium]|nr:hypothetical protein [Phycisphaerales bacterium]